MFDSATRGVRILNEGQDDRPARGTVLIVEDHADSREILHFLFHKLGCTVLEASDGAEALRLIDDTHVDLIVTDLGLPEMGGLELVKRVRADKRNQPDLKIALVTAYDLASHLDAAFEAGCDLVLAKPIGLDEFDCLVSLLPQSTKSQFYADNTPIFQNQHVTGFREAKPMIR